MNVTKTYINALTPRLSERDFAIIETVGKFKLTTGGQLERLHFSECAPSSRARSRQFVLARLVKHKVLVPLGKRPKGGASGGSGSYLYTLDKAGVAIAAYTSEAPRRPLTEYAPHYAHELAVVDLYVRLVEAEREGRLKLLKFDAEPYCWRDFGDKTLKPDAFIRLGLRINGTKVTGKFFIEVDRANEWGTKIASKVPMYLAAKAAETHGRRFPRVLFLAPTERRVGYLQRLVDSQAGSDVALFTTGLLDDFESLLVP